MVFIPTAFCCFSPLCWCLTAACILQSGHNGLLLVASYVFYASWGKRFCVLLLGLTVLVYAAGLLLGQKKRRWLFWLGLGGTLGALLVYKYLDFGHYSINALTRALGLGEPMPRVSLLQPAASPSSPSRRRGISSMCIGANTSRRRTFCGLPCLSPSSPAPFRTHRQGEPIASPV